MKAASTRYSPGETAVSEKAPPALTLAASGFPASGKACTVAADASATGGEKLSCPETAPGCGAAVLGRSATSPTWKSSPGRSATPLMPCGS